MKGGKWPRQDRATVNSSASRLSENTRPHRRAGRRRTSSKRTRRCEVKRKRIDLVAGAQIDLGHDRVMAGDTSDARAVFRFSLSRLLKFPFIFTTTCTCFIATSIKSIAA